MTTDDKDLTAGPADPISPEDITGQGELDSEQILERAILYALEQASEKLEQSDGFDPFTILIKGEELFIEDQPGETEEESFASARRTVFQMERLCDAYVFCYDGLVELDEGPSDALIVEHANKKDEQAQIIVCLYHIHDDHYHFSEDLYHVGEAPTLFSGSTSSGEGDGGDKGSEADENEASR